MKMTMYLYGREIMALSMVPAQSRQPKDGKDAQGHVDYEYVLKQCISQLYKEKLMICRTDEVELLKMTQKDQIFKRFALTGVCIT
jgi:hypothetical protein